MNNEDKEAYIHDHAYLRDDKEDYEHESMEGLILPYSNDPPTFNPDEFNKSTPDERAIYVNRKGMLDTINNSNKPMAKIQNTTQSYTYMTACLYN